MTQVATSEASAAGLRQGGPRDLSQVCSNGTEREEADWRDYSGRTTTTQYRIGCGEDGNESTAVGRGERRLPSHGQEQGCQSEGGTGLKKGERLDLGLDLLHLSYHLSNPMEKGERVQMGQWC